MTIDNADGALPIDYTEVTIRRTMFRGGGSEYAINDTPCRLLDVQELLSDSGIGREMHVIVGQGRLDAVLRATPEERRGFVEEAAGVLKHRKRKERALRKLEQMAGNLTRVQDLTAEIRRQLGPLGRQAETARRAVVIQADARDARLRLLADDLVQVTASLERDVADESALLARRTDVEQALQALDARVAALDADATTDAPAVAAAADHHLALSTVRDRVRATADVAAERARLLAEPLATPPGRDPEQLYAEARAAAEQEEALAAQVAAAEVDLADAVAAKDTAEQALHEENERIARLARAAADRREGLARLQGQVGARRSRVEAAEAEIGRLHDAVGAAQGRAADAAARFAELEGSIADVESGEEDLDARYETAEARLASASSQVEALQEELRAVEQARGAGTARVEALQLGLRRKDGAAAILALSLPGVAGAVSTLVEVEPGAEAAVAAALGRFAEAVVVDDLEAARAVLHRLRVDDGGQAALLVTAQAPRTVRPPWPELPAGARWAVDVVRVEPEVRPAVVEVLDRVALLVTPDDAPRLVEQGVRVVLPDGDVIGPGWALGGSASAPSLFEVQAAVDHARATLDAADQDARRVGAALDAARGEARQAQREVETALDALNANDAELSAVAEQLGALGATSRAARAEAERTQARIGAAEQALAEARRELAALEERLTASTDDAPVEEASAEQRDALAEAAAAARAHEMAVRLALRTTQERARAVAGRAASLDRAARQEEAVRAQAQTREERRRRDVDLARVVEDGARRAVVVLDAAVLDAGHARAALETRRQERDTALVAARREAAAHADELRTLTDAAHREELARAEQRLRVEQLEQRAVDELGIEPSVLVDEYGPHQPIPVLGDDGQPDIVDEQVQTVAYERAEQEKRLRRAERGLNALGKVNPLALEEYAALEERHTFLTTQLDDLKRSRRDLLDIVAEVDARVQQVFAEAFADTERAFVGVFSRLFPGGEGRLLLTDPDDMLTTGIEVEARPPGKKVKRLSLLSGGERSLVAVALLVAIFQARPSPFYIMDEVEAALDDANLGRLIMLFEELRASSQLIVITHQKRTMEIADALYGVSMRGDGVTRVISQRMADLPAPSDAPSSADAIKLAAVKG